MKISKRLAGVVCALSMAIAGFSTASASVLFQPGTTFYSMTDFGAYGEYQPLAECRRWSPTLP